MHEKTQLRAWALQADALATAHYNHRFRDKLIRALYLQITHYQQRNRPLWQVTLMSLCEPLLGNFPVPLEHTEVKAFLFLIRDTCFYLADKLDDRYYEWLEIIYDHDGKPQRNTSGSVDPFIGWADTHFSTDDDDNIDLDDIPL